MTTSRQDKAGAVADDELLRLARKAWPGEAPTTACVEGPAAVVRDVDGYTLVHLLGNGEARALQALHAALLVLAGEVDLQALLDARSAPAEGTGK